MAYIFIFAAHHKQRNAESNPAHKKSLQSKKLGLKGIGVFDCPDKTSFFYYRQVTKFRDIRPKSLISPTDQVLIWRGLYFYLVQLSAN